MMRVSLRTRPTTYRSSGNTWRGKAGQPLCPF
jgi:hypothetical protein